LVPQPLLRPRSRRAHAPHATPSAAGAPRVRTPSGHLGPGAQRARVRGPRRVHESACGDARARRNGLLHPRLHDLAQAHDGAEHRYRRGRRRDPAARRLGRHHRLPRPRGLAALRDPLLLVPRAFLCRRDHGGQHIAPLATSIAAGIAALLYVIGVRRMRRPWPVWRTGLFLLGLAALLAALGPPIDGLVQRLFSVHMVQHMLFTVAAAPLLMLGAPVRPLLRGLPRAVRAGIVRPLARSREIRAVLHFLRNPLVAGPLYVGGLYAWHLPGL